MKKSRRDMSAFEQIVSERDYTEKQIIDLDKQIEEKYESIQVLKECKEKEQQRLDEYEEIIERLSVIEGGDPFEDE